MEVCGNCTAQITCGCQKRTASDGSQVCANCLESYEVVAAQKKNEAQINNDLVSVNTYLNSFN